MRAKLLKNGAEDGEAGAGASGEGEGVDGETTDVRAEPKEASDDLLSAPLRRRLRR